MESPRRAKMLNEGLGGVNKPGKRRR